MGSIQEMGIQGEAVFNQGVKSFDDALPPLQTDPDDGKNPLEKRKGTIPLIELLD